MTDSRVDSRDNALLGVGAIEGTYSEFNEMNVFSRTFLKGFMDFLDDYEPFRILPRGRLLSLRPYRAFRVEIFAYQNIIFIREDLV